MAICVSRREVIGRSALKRFRRLTVITSATTVCNERIKRAIDAAGLTGQTLFVPQFVARLCSSLIGKQLRHSDGTGVFWGHADVRTTMIYTHVLNKGGRGVQSPLDEE